VFSLNKFENTEKKPQTESIIFKIF